MSSAFIIWWVIGALLLLAVAGWGLVLWFWWQRGSTVSMREAVAQSGPVAPDWAELIEIIPAYMLMLDHLGTVLHVNREARQQFGERLGGVMRHPVTRSVLEAALRSGMDKKTRLCPIFSTSLTLDVPVSWTVHLAVRCLPASREADRRLLVVLSDRSEAQAVDRMRVDFVSHASHELRTPLASMSGFIEALRHERGEEEERGRRQQALEIMAQQAERMRRLIDRLLYLSHVQARQSQRPDRVVEVDELMAHVLDEVGPRFAHGSDTLTLEVEEGLFLHADADELVQVFLNLIENALKYARQETQPLMVTLLGRRITPDDPLWPGESGVLLGVCDNGRGIAPHHLPRLTERFYRVKVRDLSAISGSGLGLSIVRHSVERHGGRFQIKSTLGQGTSCLIWLPDMVVQEEPA